MIYLGDEWGVCEVLAGVSPAVRYIDRITDRVIEAGNGDGSEGDGVDLAGHQYVWLECIGPEGYPL